MTLELAVRNTASLFKFDGPVPLDRLINRRREVDAIKACTRGGRLMALVSPRRYGKTSLIHKVAAEGVQDGLVVITADLFEVASLSDLVLRLERAWKLHTPEELRPAVSKILGAAQAGVPITGSGFALAMANHTTIDPLPALHVLLELPVRLAEREGRRTLIALDEFQCVGGVPGAEDLLWEHASQHRETISYLFSGGRLGMLSAMDDDGTFSRRQVEILRLDRLPTADLRVVIKQQFAEGGRDVAGVVDELVTAGEGHPQRAMQLAHLLWQEVPVGQQATSDHLDLAIAAGLQQIDPEARATVTGLTVGQRKVLRAVAEYGTPMAARALRTLNLPKTTAQKAAPHLVAAGVIEDAGQGWQLIDPLLARWIRTNYGTRA